MGMSNAWMTGIGDAKIPVKFIISLGMTLNSKSGVHWVRVKIYGPVFEKKNLITTYLSFCHIF